jgi:hypothetical protein
MVVIGIKKGSMKLPFPTTTITTHGFSISSNWLNLSFWLIDMYILTKGQGLNDTCLFVN